MLNREKILKVYEENKINIMEDLKEIVHNSFFEPVFNGWSSHLYISENDYSFMGPVSAGHTSMDCYNGIEECVLIIPADRELEELSECSIEDFMNYVEENGINYDFEKVKREYIEEQIYLEKREDATDEEIEAYEDDNYYEVVEYVMEDFTNQHSDVETNILEEAFELYWDDIENIYDDKIRYSIENMIAEEDCE